MRRALPLTLGFLAAQAAANAWAGTFHAPLSPELLQRWGVGVEAVLGRGEVWRLATATVLAHDPGMLARQVLFAAGAFGVHEALWGWRRTAGIFAGVDVGATLVVLGVLAALMPGTEGAATLHDVGMSAGGFGLLGSLLAGWRRGPAILAAGLAALLLKVAVVFDPIADGVHVVALLGGFGLHRRLLARAPALM